MKACTIPGKIFLMGEYSVLKGGPALLCALKPGYRFTDDSSTIHESSPAAVYAKEYGLPLQVKLSADDSMRPGFGTSSAECLANIHFATGRYPELSEFWPWLRKHYPTQSGSDLATQLQALQTGASFFKVEGFSHCEALPKSGLLSKIWLFQNSTKVKTHEDLVKRDLSFDERSLNQMLNDFERHCLANEVEAFPLLSQFANHLFELGYESHSAHTIRGALQKVDGVLGVKGCGASLHDAFVVAYSGTDLMALHEVARAHSLTFLGNLRELLW